MAWVSFAIMPLFAFANAGVSLTISDVTSGVALAVMLGLVVGKPLGIVTFSWLAVKSGVAQLPAGVTWKMVVAGGCLSGIGFTMAIFIASLAFQATPEVLDVAKIGVLSASFLSAVLGIALLLYATRPAEGRAS